ncbi:MAG TPA: choice-of-anchor D domain-containing protein [Candidatus Kapabacteria bacterium]|nr:choice-of-anchor D domain-containing protein [Candidatus Kapabacteria bacterium]
MKPFASFRFAFGSFAMAVLAAVVFGLAPSSALAQTGHDGISAAGTDFFLSQMPNIPFSQSWQQFENGSPGGYFLIGNFQDGNTVTIDYFDPSSGLEHIGKSFTNLKRGQCIQYSIDPNSMTPTKPGEMIEWKSAHITSTYPITVQFYREGTSNGNLYQGIPTAALGENYVIAAWNDCPHDDAPNSDNPDSTSSECLIIAAYDNTNVTIIPNSTTYAGVTGYNTGAGYTSSPHPITITLQRGQIYWIRSEPTALSNDLSGTTIAADKPIAVLGGQERGMMNDPQAQGSWADEDPRDGMVEQMTPLESWGTDYPSIPTMPAGSSSCNPSGDGDLYRFFTADVRNSAWSGYSEGQSGMNKYGPQPLTMYQAPAADWENVTNPVDLLTDSSSRDASGHIKKMYALQYHYFQWVASGEVSYRSDNEMNLVPIDHWEKSTVFMVPHNSHYNGNQFINLITTRDSLSKISVTFNSTSTGPLSLALQAIKTYQIPLHPELVGLTYKLASGNYLIYGNTPFACYCYGRTEPDAKTISGYAAPSGQVYGTNAQPNAPKADITPSCGAWHVHISEPEVTGNDGLADVIFLEDPDGFFVKPARVSTNCRTSPQPPLTALPFEVGDSSLDFDVQVDDPTQPADAYVYVVDRDGNDTVLHLHYIPTAFATSQDTIAFPVTQVGDTQVSTFTFHVVSTGNYPSIYVPTAVLEHLDKNANDFTITSNPTLPATLIAGDSVVFTVTFTSIDTNRHFDKLDLVTGCLNDTVPLMGQQATPIILAGNWDFGNVPVGDTVCKEITVENIGAWNLILDSSYHYALNLPTDYTFEGPIPDTIMPGGITTEKTLRFCFHPSTTGSSGTVVNWETNLNGLYQHDKKDSTVLLGYGSTPGMGWDRYTDTLTVECESYDTVRRYLINTSSGTNGGNISVKELMVIGPDSSDVTILDYGERYGGANAFSSFAPFQLTEDSSEFVDLQFKPTLANGFADRYANVVANGVNISDANTTYTDTIKCVGIVRHAIVTVNPPTYDFGAQAPGSQLTHTFTITNTGDTAFVYTGFNLTGSDFAILSEPAVGSSLEPGQTDTIVLQYTAKQNGGRSAVTINIGGDHSYCNTETILSTGLSEGVAVAETPVNYPITYICHNDSLSLTATNEGTGGSAAVLLDSVQIVDYQQGTPVANQFAFTSNNSQLITWPNGLVVDSAQTVPFPVRFTPAYSIMDSVQAIFYWEDTSRGQTRFFQDTRKISGIGYQTVDTISLSKPAAAASNTYTAVTANEVSMPVQLVLPFDTIAQVYGMEFTIRYYRDAFVFLGANSVQPRSDLQVVSADTSDDATNTNYQLLTIHLKSNTGAPIINSGTVATVNLQYVIGKDSISPFDVKDVMFLDQNQSSVCWVSNGSVPTSFYGQNLCGDATLRMYLHGGMPAFSIQDIVPNPIAQTASIHYTVAQDGVPVTMQVFNALGQPVATLIKNEPQAKGSYQATLDASMFPSGLYTIYVSTPGFGISKQVVVTK